MAKTEELLRIGETLGKRRIESWRQSGGKVIGYSCTYMPEEIIHAAGMMPYRLRGIGCRGISIADSYLSRTSHCSFARTVLELALTGGYGFLDGVVYTNGCDHMRRGYDNWKAQRDRPAFMHMLPVPHTITDHGLKWYEEELGTFKGQLEDHFGAKIDDASLRRSIGVYNETRRLLKELYRLRTEKAPQVTGAETLRMVVASTSVPREKYNKLLAEALEEIKSSEGTSDYKSRVMVVGSASDDPAFLDLVESTGGLVVADSLCFGARYFWDLEEDTGDPMHDIAVRYYYHIPCPRMYGEYPARLDFVRGVAKASNADGVIVQAIKYCDLHGVENAMLDKSLEEEGIPVLRLEREYGPSADMGRIRTRVQAFLERIGR
jgi:bzd-type benzoyl-CoA reductase N subunit